MELDRHIGNSLVQIEKECIQPLRDALNTSLARSMLSGSTDDGDGDDEEVNPNAHSDIRYPFPLSAHLYEWGLSLSLEGVSDMDELFTTKGREKRESVLSVVEQ